MSHLPPNTLCISLDPPGQLFFLPQNKDDRRETSRSRSPSPAGYNSDPESNARSVKPLSSLPKIKVSGLQGADKAVPQIPPTHSSRKGRLKSATWQDLFKCVFSILCVSAALLNVSRLVNIQSVIRGTEDSLADIVRDVGTHVVHNGLNISVSDVASMTLVFSQPSRAHVIFLQLREASEREARIQELAAHKAAVCAQSNRCKRSLPPPLPS